MTLEAEQEPLEEQLPTEELPPPRRRRGGMIVSVAVLVIFGVGIWYAYRHYVVRGEPAAPPLIKAEQGPIKVPPDNPGGLQVPNQDKAIYDRLNGNAKPDRIEKLLPPPEAPKPEALTPPAPPASAPAAAPAAPPKPADTAASPAVPPSVSPAAGSGSATVPATPPPAALNAPPSTPANASPNAPPPKTSQATAAIPKVAAASPPLMTKGVARIQLGAFRQEAEAQQQWQQLQKKYPDVLGSLSPAVVKADLGSKGVFQRLQAGPLPDRAAALAACDKLKARHQDCLVVSP